MNNYNNNKFFNIFRVGTIRNLIFNKINEIGLLNEDDIYISGRDLNERCSLSYLIKYGKSNLFKERLQVHLSLVDEISNINSNNSSNKRINIDNNIINEMFDRFIDIALRKRNIDVIQHLINRLPKKKTKIVNTILNAIKDGSLELVKLVLMSVDTSLLDEYFVKRCLTAALLYDRLDIATFLVEFLPKGYLLSDNNVNQLKWTNATISGSNSSINITLEIVKLYLKGNRFYQVKIIEIGQALLIDLAKMNSLDLIVDLLSIRELFCINQIGSPIITESTFSELLERCQFDAIKYIIDSINSNSIQLIKFIYINHQFSLVGVCKTVFSSRVMNDFDIFKYLYDNLIVIQPEYSDMEFRIKNDNFILHKLLLSNNTESVNYILDQMELSPIKPTMITIKTTINYQLLSLSLLKRLIDMGSINIFFPNILGDAILSKDLLLIDYLHSTEFLQLYYNFNKNNKQNSNNKKKNSNNNKNNNNNKKKNNNNSNQDDNDDNLLFDYKYALNCAIRAQSLESVKLVLDKCMELSQSIQISDLKFNIDSIQLEQKEEIVEIDNHLKIIEYIVNNHKVGGKVPVIDLNYNQCAIGIYKLLQANDRIDENTSNFFKTFSFVVNAIESNDLEWMNIVLSIVPNDGNLFYDYDDVGTLVASVTNFGILANLYRADIITLHSFIGSSYQKHKTKAIQYLIDNNINFDIRMALEVSIIENQPLNALLILDRFKDKILNNDSFNVSIVLHSFNYGRDLTSIIGYLIENRKANQFRFPFHIKYALENPIWYLVDTLIKYHGEGLVQGYQLDAKEQMYIAISNSHDVLAKWIMEGLCKDSIDRDLLAESIKSAVINGNYRLLEYFKDLLNKK